MQFARHDSTVKAEGMECYRCEQTIDPMKQKFFIVYPGEWRDDKAQPTDEPPLYVHQECRVGDERRS